MILMQDFPKTNTRCKGKTHYFPMAKDSQRIVYCDCGKQGQYLGQKPSLLRLGIDSK